jgi:hypothetical protein
MAARSEAEVQIDKVVSFKEAPPFGRGGSLFFHGTGMRLGSEKVMNLLGDGFLAVENEVLEEVCPLNPLER